MPSPSHPQPRTQPSLPTNPRLRAIGSLLLDLYHQAPQRAHTQRRIVSALETLSLVDLVVDENHIIEYISRADEEEEVKARAEVERMKKGMEGKKRKKGEGEEGEGRKKGRMVEVEGVERVEDLEEWEIIEVEECKGTEKNGRSGKGWMVGRLVKFVMGREGRGV